MLKTALICLLFLAVVSAPAGAANFSKGAGCNQNSADSGLNYSDSSESDELMSVARYRFLSLGATAGSVVLIAIPGVGPFLAIGTYLAAPSMGSYYAGNSSRFWRSVTTRSIIAGVGGVGFMGTFMHCWSEGCSYHIPIATATILATAIHGLYDIFFISTRSIRDYNDRLSGGNSVSVTPWINTGQTGAGLSVRIQF